MLGIYSLLCADDMAHDWGGGALDSFRVQVLVIRETSQVLRGLELRALCPCAPGEGLVIKFHQKWLMVQIRCVCIMKL